MHRAELLMVSRVGRISKWEDIAITVSWNNMKFLLPHFILPIHPEAWSLGMIPGLGYGGMTLMLSRGKATTVQHTDPPTIRPKSQWPSLAFMDHVDLVLWRTEWQSDVLEGFRDGTPCQPQEPWTFRWSKKDCNLASKILRLEMSWTWSSWRHHHKAKIIIFAT